MIFLNAYIKKRLQKENFFDRWVDGFLVHYNYYQSKIEVKKDFHTIYGVDVSLFMRINRKYRKLVYRAFGI